MTGPEIGLGRVEGTAVSTVKPQIENELMLLDDAVNYLFDRLDRLMLRLDPVSLPNTEAPKNPNNNRPDNLCKIAIVIRSKQEDIVEIGRRVDQMTDLLQI